MSTLPRCPHCGSEDLVINDTFHKAFTHLLTEPNWDVNVGDYICQNCKMRYDPTTIKRQQKHDAYWNALCEVCTKPRKEHTLPELWEHKKQNPKFRSDLRHDALDEFIRK